MKITGAVPEELLYIKEMTETIKITNVDKVFERIGGRKGKRGFLVGISKPKKKK